MSYIPTDDEATLLLDSVETEQDPARKTQIVGLLETYRENKRKAGLEPFQADPDATRKRIDGANALYEGLESIEAKLPPERRQSYQQAIESAMDRDELKARTVNQSWVIANQPEAASLVDADWDYVKRDVAKNLLKLDKTEISDRELYTGIAGHLKAKKQREEKAHEMLGKIQAAAFDGESDWLTAYRAHSSALEDLEGLSPAERDHYRDASRKVFEHAATKAKELRPVADTVLSSLGRETGATGFNVRTGFSRDTLISMLADLPADDRRLVYRMVAIGAQSSIETEQARGKGAAQKVGEKFWRQVRDIATDQIETFEQGAIADEMQTASAKDEDLFEWKPGKLVARGVSPFLRADSDRDTLNRIGFRTPFPEEIATFRKGVERKKVEYDVARELKDIAENVVDPAKFDNRFIDGVANAPGQLAYSAQAAVPVVGLSLLVNGTQAARTRELLDRGVPLTEARDIAAASALAEAPIEWVQSKMVFGRIPGMKGLMSQPLTSASLSAMGKKSGVLFATEYGLQNAQELVQDAAPMLLQDVTASWDESVPKTTKEDWSQFWNSRIDTAFTLLPITLLGTGVASFRDAAYSRQYLENEQILTAAGFTEQAREQIVSAPTLEAKEATVEGMWANPEMRKVGTTEQVSALADLDGRMAQQVEGMPAGGAELNADGTFTIRDESGDIVDRAANAETAAELLAEVEAKRVASQSQQPATASQPVAGFESSNEEAAPLGLNMPNAATVSFNPATDDRISAPQVMDAFGRVLEAVGQVGEIRAGRVKGKSTLGAYYVREQLARIKTANDVNTAAHEMAHALEDAVYGLGNIWQHNPAIPPSARGELLTLGKQLYGPKVPNGGYHSEGWAEFIRLTLTDPAQAQAKAPQFSAFWASELAKDEKLATAFTDAQKAAETWLKQGSKARAEQGIAQQPSTLQKVKEAAADQAGAFYRNFIEQAAAIQDFVQEAEERGGATIPDQNNPMITLTSRRLTADSVVEYMANKGMLDFAGNVTGKPLVDAFKLVGEKSQDFLLYLWAKRADALWNDPKTGPRNPGLAREDASFLVQTLETPEFQKAAQIVYDWNNGVLNYAAQASPDFAETVRKIREADPGFYIPLYREFKAFDDRAKGAGGAKGQNLVAKLKGSGRRIKDPVASMLVHAKNIVLKAQQKRVLDQILTIAEKVPGLGHYVIEVRPDQVPQASKTLQEILEAANARLKQLGSGLQVKNKATLAMQGVDLEAEMLTFFAPAYQPKQNENPVLPVFRNGKVRWYEMDQDLYATLSGMDIYRLPKALDILFGIPARTMRLGTTGLRASFSLVTNPLRDFRTLHLNSQASANSAKLFFDWLGTLKDLAIDALTNGKATNQWADLAERLGVQMAQPLGQDTQPLNRAARRLKRGGEFKLWDPRDQYDFVLGLFQFTETATRLTEMKNIAADLGWDPSQPLTPAIAAKLANAGKQVTTDFTQAGTIARAINQAVPFFNAGIQGPVAHVRALKANPTKFVIRGLMLTSLALANWYRNKDEEWWKEMPLEERYGFTYVPVGDELVRIPRAFEADGLFMAGAEALADAWYTKDPQGVTEWFGKWLGGFTQFDSADGVPVPPMPVLVQMAAEQLANRDFFSDAPIVPRAQEDLASEEQFGTYTSRASIKIGEVFGVSPRRIDHAINSIFGGVGSDIVGLLGRGNNDIVTRESEMSDLPVFGVLFQRGGQQARNPESVEKLYDVYAEVLRSQRSTLRQESIEQQQRRLMVQDAVRAVIILEDVKLLTPDKDKRAELEAEQIAVAREAVASFQSGTIDRAPSLAAKGRANAKQFERAQELGLQPRPGDRRPLRSYVNEGKE